MNRRKLLLAASLLILVALLSLSGLTYRALHPLPNDLTLDYANLRKVQIIDRQGQPLTITYQNHWNVHDYLALHQIPESLQQIFILSEDQRFYSHQGVDWYARWHAVLQNLLAGRIVRGASTLSEQTVRMLHPRPRTFWSRWLEGIEAGQLEQKFSKADILEFYLNQVPYASQRRGVVQAARHYFDRDLATLNLKEQLALAVLVRAPSRLDLHQDATAIEPSIQRLATRLHNLGWLNATEYAAVQTFPLAVQSSDLAIQATHFVHYLYRESPPDYLQQAGRIQTTLDARLQTTVQHILDNRLAALKNRNAHNGAVLVVDHQQQAVLAWVNGGHTLATTPNQAIDAITTPRQPGSTLKPFLYALALERGWTPATLLEDVPLAEAVGTGLHSFRNYSRQYYGAMRLRDALGNSLNIPAIKTVQFVGAENLLQRLQQLGITSLTEHPTHYGDGLALGNGALTLLELVQAYTVLAKQGQFVPLRLLENQPTDPPQPVLTPAVSSLISHILADPDARRLEFGRSALLQFPVETAVKTGTSTDYHDAWAVGFNHRYTVGVWLGNLDQTPMQKVSGATGPALVLRAIFAELNRHNITRPLWHSPELQPVQICRDTGRFADNDCASRTEWFITGTEPQQNPARQAQVAQSTTTRPFLRQPSAGLQLAMDPRIPDHQEAFTFLLVDAGHPINRIEWVLNDEVVGTSRGETRQFLWPMQRGTYHAQARVWSEDSNMQETPSVTFFVK